MTNKAHYGISDSDGTQLCNGLSPEVARAAAQRRADDLGRSVWLWQADSEGDGEEFTPGGASVIGYVTWGSVRGEGPTRATRAEAEADLRRDANGCRRQGGYSDRHVYWIDADGYARDDEGGYVWPHGPSHRALSVDCEAAVHP